LGPPKKSGVSRSLLTPFSFRATQPLPYCLILAASLDVPIRSRTFLPLMRLTTPHEGPECSKSVAPKWKIQTRYFYCHKQCSCIISTVTSSSASLTAVRGRRRVSATPCSG